MYHQAKLSSAAKLAAINREYEHKQQLIEKAKAEYSKSKSPASAKTESGGSTFVPAFVIFPSRASGLQHILTWICLENIVSSMLNCLQSSANRLRIVIRDPNDSRFDLEAYLNVVDAENL
jgi:F-type H+-transporting ATP synthase subunit e